MKLFKIKRGDTFQIKPSKLISDSGLVVPLTGYTIASHVRDIKDTLIVNLTMTIAGETFMSNPVDTLTWPLIDLYCDIQFVKDGKTISSDTLTIRVQRDETHA